MAEELGDLFSKCNAIERLTFQFFLGTGCREREVAFATWKDVDLTTGTFTVKAKPAMMPDHDPELAALFCPATARGAMEKTRAR